MTMSAFPKIWVTLLFIWSYWVIVFKILRPFPIGKFTTIILFIITTFELVLSLYTYYLVVHIGPGSPLDHLELVVPNYDEANIGTEMDISPPSILKLNSVMVKNNGGYRFCQKCKVWKPDRSHHCSSCGKCILRMDHHCPWFGECIGWSNHRYFMQFLFHSNLYLIVISLISVFTLLTFFGGGLGIGDGNGNGKGNASLDLFSLHIIFVGILGVIFALCVSVLGGLTMWQLFKNKTTIEAFEDQRYKHSGRLNVFDIGKRSNWSSVMGFNWKEWIFPITVTDLQIGKGLFYQTNDPQEQYFTSFSQRVSREIERRRGQIPV